MRGLLLLLRALVLAPARRHPLRVALPVIGVAIGVAAVAAIHRANRSVTESFQQAASALAGESDLVITGPRGVPLSALEGLAFLWRVGSFAPAMTGHGVLEGSGEVVEILGLDFGGDRAVRQMHLVEPSGPAGLLRLVSEGSVLVPVRFARRHGLSLGSERTLIAGGRPRRVVVGGLLELSGVARAAGGELLVADLFTAQALLGRPDTVDRVDVVLDSGVSPKGIRRELERRLPADLSVEPPGRAAETADRMVRAFRFNLNALGSLTLLVGIFLIANAVSISVLRRRPEIATLRAVGAGRASLFAVFLIEGLAIGAAGTALGEIGGVFLSRAAIEAVSGTVASVYLPTARISASGYEGPAALAAGVGLLAALAATLLPAAEAIRVPPSPAMRPGAIEGVRRKRLAPRGAWTAAALAGAVLLSRAGPVDGFPLFGFIAVGFVVAALALSSPLLVRGAAGAARGPLRSFFGVAGRLASRFFGGSLARNGIAVSALAMALGMTLAMIVTVASIRETVRLWVESTLQADLWIKSDSGGRPGIVSDLPEEIIALLASLPGVAAVDPFRATPTIDAAGRPFTLASGDFRVVARMGGLPLLDGRDPREAAARAREEGAVLVSEPYARRFGLGRGDTVTLRTPQGTRNFRIEAVYRDFSNDRGTVVLDRQLAVSLFGDRRVTSLAVTAAPGVSPDELRRRVLERSRGRFALSVTTNRELRREVLAIFDQTFAVTRALEAIAVAVAILGIANASIASVIERRRSFALLRAVGASRAQIRGAVLLEAILAGLAATAAAAVSGAAFAAILLLVINPQSFGWTVALRLPWGDLAGVTFLVLVASVAAAVFPSRLAAAVDPAAALAEE